MNKLLQITLYNSLNITRQRNPHCINEKQVSYINIHEYI